MDIAAWLRGLGLERYEQTFRDHEIDGEVLARLTADDLKAAGIAAVGHRRRLLDAIAALTPGDGTADIPAAPPASRAERRQITVMFVDLVGSTALASRLDPEETREVLRAYQNAVTGEIARVDGHVAKLMGQPRRRSAPASCRPADREPGQIGLFDFTPIQLAIASSRPMTPKRGLAEVPHHKNPAALRSSLGRLPGSGAEHLPRPGGCAGIAPGNPPPAIDDRRSSEPQDRRFAVQSRARHEK